MLTKDVIFVTHMLALKQLLEKAFEVAEKTAEQQIRDRQFLQTHDNKYAYTLGEYTASYTKTLQFGVFTNTCVIELLERIKVPTNIIVNDLLPKVNKQIPNINDFLAKIILKTDMLRSDKAQFLHLEKNLINVDKYGLLPPNGGESLPIISRIPPTIRHNGILFLMEALIKKDWGGTIAEFVDEFRK